MYFVEPSSITEREHDMAGEPTITIIGNTVADIDLRFTSSGDAVASFTVASTPRTFDKAAQEWKDGETLFIRCSVWRDMAENVAQSLTKGTRVIVQGRLTQRSYEDRDGNKRTSLDLAVDEIGPSLKRAVAKVEKRSSGTGGSPFAQPQTARELRGEPDPWGSGGAASEGAPF